jgi:hypothetical protein
MNKKSAAAEKQADMYGALMGGTNLGLAGGVIGGGLGGAYGLASGALGSRKGSRIKDTLRGGLRGAVGGGLLGGGTGAGLGAAAIGQFPVSEIVNAIKNTGKTISKERFSEIQRGFDPATFSGLTTLGGLGGAALGGYASRAILDDKNKEDEEEKQSAFDFGKTLGDIGTYAKDMYNKVPESVRSGAGMGGLGGAALGGLAGLVAPGEDVEYDEMGREVKRNPRSRFGAMLRGAVGGGMMGAAAGGAAGHFAPGPTNNLINKLRYQYTMHTPVPTKAQAQTRQNFTAAGEEPFVEDGVMNPAMQAAQS